MLTRKYAFFCASLSFALIGSFIPSPIPIAYLLLPVLWMVSGGRYVLGYVLFAQIFSLRNFQTIIIDWQSLILLGQWFHSFSTHTGAYQSLIQAVNSSVQYQKAHGESTQTALSSTLWFVRGVDSLMIGGLGYYTYKFWSTYFRMLLSIRRMLRGYYGKS